MRFRWAVDDSATVDDQEVVSVGDSLFVEWNEEPDEPVERLEELSCDQSETHIEDLETASVSRKNGPVMYGAVETDKTDDASEERSARATSRYARLFLDEEFEAMENCQSGEEGTVLAKTEVNVEGEYTKEVEEKLFPLDEVEIRRRVEVNRKAAEGPSLETMATYLEIPLETLQRTQSATVEEISSPEYWETWFSETLESSEAVRCANRDFRQPRADSISVSAVTNDVIPTKESLPQ
ncbi:unnamed protein product [Phytophthora fragariaefolia]|uniref:Unnamed protein product n=1 Tax=Phytophthora fragariaefolia TaxID=1490495 RepID=A0A9W6XQT9_9STRA|nr:unnamed protein product [Phytophthora fragariaefolia]